MALSEPILTKEECELARRVAVMWQEMSHHEQQTSFVDRQLKWITKLCENVRTADDEGVVMYRSSITFNLADGRKLRVAVQCDLIEDAHE